jgi:nicotinamidase-related amidase
MVTVDPKTTALVLIDLQDGILKNALAPISGTELLRQGKLLAEKFRAAGAPVILVNVGWAADSKDALHAPVDRSTHPKAGVPAGFSKLADGLAAEGDLLITKHQWDAFTGTELDLQLRRRGINTIVLGGVATNLGVESTARRARDLNYAVVLALHATTSVNAEMHDFAVNRIFPLISRVTDDIAFS